MLMNKTLAIFVALTLVVSAVSIALVVDDAQAGKNKPPKVRGDKRCTEVGGNGDNGGNGTEWRDGNGNGNNGADGQAVTGTNG